MLLRLWEEGKGPRFPQLRSKGHAAGSRCLIASFLCSLSKSMLM